MADMQATRRRAAVAVFSDLLEEAALTEALWLQHESMRGENVSDIIAFVDAVAQRNLLDSASVKRLYNGFYKALRENPDRLPLDPWPSMQAARAAIRPSAPPPARCRDGGSGERAGDSPVHLPGKAPRAQLRAFGR